MQYWNTIQENFEPWLMSNLISLILIVICFRWVRSGRLIWGVLFITASIINVYIAWTEPELYPQAYGESAAVGVYKTFIMGWFAEHVALVVTIIGVGQFLVGIGLVFGGPLLYPALWGGALFFLAIAPLGIGSAFPSTVLMALSFWIIHLQNQGREIKEIST
jgi:hypothetical protein